MKHLPLMLSSMLLASSCTQAATPAVDDFDIACQQAADKGAAIQVLLEKDGKVLKDKAYGTRNAKGDPVDTQTLFSIASLTKPVTSAAVMRLVQAGKISLDDTLVKFFPSIPKDKAGITLKQVLSHSGGLSEYHGGDYDPMTKEEAQAAIFKVPLRFTPGSQSGYSNSGYTLLAMIIEQVSGKPYETAMKELVFEPAGMSRAHFYGQIPDDTNVTVGRGGRKVKDNQPNHWDYTWALKGAGGIMCTAGDLYRFALALKNPEFLKQDLQDVMNTPVAGEPGGPKAEALGWLIGTSRRGTKVANHGGGNMYGFHTMIFRYLEEDAVVVILCNTGPEVSTQDLVTKAMQTLFPPKEQRS